MGISDHGVASLEYNNLSHEYTLMCRCGRKWNSPKVQRVGWGYDSHILQLQKAAEAKALGVAPPSEPSPEPTVSYESSDS